MEKKSQGQVQLFKLIFTHNWEDPLVDEEALQIKQGDTVFTITSGGCNTLGFLRFSPERIFCVDINPAQTYLMNFKQAAFKNLSQGEIWKLFGMSPYADREWLYQKIKKDIPADAISFFKKQKGLIRNGIIMQGRYEKFVKIAGTLLRMLEGSKKTKSFFKLTSIEDQKAFYQSRWNNRRWKWIFKAMFNKKRLAKKGLNADYFHFDDGSTSFSESFYKRAGHAMMDIPVQQNYFLALYLLGHYTNHIHIPEYLKPECFSIINKNIQNIFPVTEDSKYWLEKQPDNFFDAMSLSNICELMNDTDTHKLFSEVARTAKPGARLVFRNLMIPREVPEDLRHIIVKNESLSKELQYNDRSFVYGKVAAYTIKK